MRPHQGVFSVRRTRYTARLEYCSEGFGDFATIFASAVVASVLFGASVNAAAAATNDAKARPISSTYFSECCSARSIIVFLPSGPLRDSLADPGLDLLGFGDHSRYCGVRCDFQRASIAQRLVLRVAQAAARVVSQAADNFGSWTRPATAPTSCPSQKGTPAATGA